MHKQKADTIVEEVKEKKVIDKEHETKLLLRLTSVKVLKRLTTVPSVPVFEKEKEKSAIRSVHVQRERYTHTPNSSRFQGSSPVPCWHCGNE